MKGVRRQGLGVALKSNADGGEVPPPKEHKVKDFKFYPPLPWSGSSQFRIPLSGGLRKYAQLQPLSGPQMYAPSWNCSPLFACLLACLPVG